MVQADPYSADSLDRLHRSISEKLAESEQANHTIARDEPQARQRQPISFDRVSSRRRENLRHALMRGEAQETSTLQRLLGESSGTAGRTGQVEPPWRR